MMRSSKSLFLWFHFRCSSLAKKEWLQFPRMETPGDEIPRCKNSSETFDWLKRRCPIKVHPSIRDYFADRWHCSCSRRRWRGSKLNVGFGLGKGHWDWPSRLLSNRSRWRSVTVSAQVAICCIFEIPKHWRQCPCWMITKFVWKLGLCRSSSPSTKDRLTT